MFMNVMKVPKTVFNIDWEWNDWILICKYVELKQKLQIKTWKEFKFKKKMKMKKKTYLPLGNRFVIFDISHANNHRKSE